MLRQHKNRILRLATSLSSRQAAFLFALTGVVVQAFHTYYITNELSSLSGFWRILQALLMAGFISCALLYFTLKSSDEDTKVAKRYRKTVWWFAIIETFINLYYWGNHLLIQKWPDPDYGSFLIALPFSFLIPFTLKVYAGEVRTDDYSDVEISPDEFEDTLYQAFGMEKPTQGVENPGPEVVKKQQQKKDLDELNRLLNQQLEKTQGSSEHDDPYIDIQQDDYMPPFDEDDYPTNDYDPSDEEPELEDIPEADDITESDDITELDDITEPDEIPTDTAQIEMAPEHVVQGDPESEESETAAETSVEPETETPAEPEIKRYHITKDSEESKPGSDLPELGKELLNTFSNGGLSTTPAYVAPKETTATESFVDPQNGLSAQSKKTSEEDELFDYQK